MGNFLAFVADAERRSKAGQKQYQCVCHKTWHWWDKRKGHKFCLRAKAGKGV
jgi:hypothetical protein